MVKISYSITVTYLLMGLCTAFSPHVHTRRQTPFTRDIKINVVDVSTNEMDTTIIDESKNELTPMSSNTANMEEPNGVVVKEGPRPKKKSNPSHKEGVFSPVVFLAKGLMGDDSLTKLRAKVISMHSDIISSFVNTYETAYGDLALKTLYSMADQNKDGSLDENELKSALHNLGFSWIKDKQLKGIMKRADLDGNSVIDFNEFRNEVPRTLRTNLIKLAKKNGGEMGLLV